MRRWLLFSNGRAVEAECISWDPRRDLAILRIRRAQNFPTLGSAFPSVDISKMPPSLKAPLVCIGHPGSEDLETTLSGIKTNYDVLHVSRGVFRGYAPGQDMHDNSDIGALMHDCWTYWGHSGAPLVLNKTGELIGLHSSWDEVTRMRRGVGVEAIWAFLSNSRLDIKSKENTRKDGEI